MKKQNISRFYTSLFSATLFVLSASAAAQTVSLDEALRQSSGVDTGYYPYGVPASYSWYNGDVLPQGIFPPPADFTSLTGWGQFYPMIGYPNPTCNIYVKDFKIWVHKKSGGWVLAQDGTGPGALGGGNFVADFVNNAAYALPITDMPDGSKRMQSPPYGRVAHWWPIVRGLYTANTIDGAFGIYAARVDNAACNMIGDYGIDYWRNSAAPWLADFSNNPAYGGGSWVKLTTAYQNFYYTRFTREQLMADPPPPLVGVGATAPTPAPSPSPAPTPTPAPAPTSPTTLTAPTSISGDFNFLVNGTVSNDVNFATNVYKIAITAYGTSLGGVNASMQVLIDGRVVATVNVDSATAKIFEVGNLSIAAGMHKVGVAFTNDGYVAGVGDRNLYVRKIDIQVQGSSAPTPAPTPAPTTPSGTAASASPSLLLAAQMPLHTTGAVQGDYYNLWSNGSLSQIVNFSMNAFYTIQVEALGTPADGAYPIMQILVDDEVVATATVGSTSLEVYQASVQIGSGAHKVGVAFTNDAVINGQDRNLYVRQIKVLGN